MFSRMILFLLGLVLGCFGTMIGAGGGFVLVPILLFMYPDEPAEVITAISLAVVCANAASGSIAYARKKRIDYQSAIAFALAALPGSILGVYATNFVSRRVFDPAFGAGLIIAGIYLSLKKPLAGGNVAVAKGKRLTHRELTDAEGTRYVYDFNLRTGLILSAGVGFLSSFLGIGGGIIHVPALVYLLGFPVHLATATSHLILALLSGTATLQHALDGSLGTTWSRLMYLAPGVMIGAPLGAKLSERVKGSLIMRALALALLAVGGRLIWRVFI